MISALPLSNVGDALCAAAHFGAMAYGAELMIKGGKHGCTFLRDYARIEVLKRDEKSGLLTYPDVEDSWRSAVRAASEIALGVLLTTYLGKGFKQSLHFGAVNYGALQLVIFAKRTIGVLRDDVGLAILPKDEAHLISYSGADGLNNRDFIRQMAGIAVLYFLGELASAPRLTALVFGAHLMIWGAKTTIGDLRDKYQWTWIPKEQSGNCYFSHTTPNKGVLLESMSAIIGGVTMVTLLGAKV